MNLTISRASAAHGKRLSLLHLQAVAGIAIALTAAYATGGWQTEPRVSERRPAPSAVRVADDRPVAVYEVFYLVDSPEQGVAALSQETELSRFSGQQNAALPRRSRFHVVTSDDEARTFRTTVENAEMTDTFGSRYEVIDLRWR